MRGRFRPLIPFSYRSSALNGDVILFLYCRFCFFLRNEEFQNAMFELGFDILLLHILTNIEASAHGTGITLFADVMSGLFLLLVLVETFLCLNRQITILQRYLNFIFC